MTESEFNEQLDTLMESIEEAIDASGIDVDYDNNGGLLTLLFVNQSPIILSRQTALHQLWMAAQGGGFHFDYDPKRQQWRRHGTDELFKDLLNEHVSQHYGAPVVLSF